MLTDDEPKMLGHCVIAAPMGLRHLFPTIQGLTAEDFHCGAYHAPEEENAALREADFVNAVSLTMRRNPVAE